MSVVSERRPLGYYLRPFASLRSLLGHLYLIRQFISRDITARYKGSVLGLVWMVVNPLLLLGVYTFVFGVIFKPGWNFREGATAAAPMGEYAMTLFCGLIMYILLSDSVTRAPALIVGNANYVKKMVFPLEILPVSIVGSALLLCCVSTVILLLGTLCLLGTFSVTFFCFPLVLIPLILFTLGVCWLLASLGVFLRDIGHAVGVIVLILFFMTPIFYPIAQVPAALRLVMRLNPLAIVIDSARRTLIWGEWPDWPWMIGVTVFSVIVAQLGYAWFMKTKGGFADVL
jgi:lipopolysaccharide transport system permease protein